MCVSELWESGVWSYGVCIRAVQDPMQSVSDLYKVVCSLHRLCIRSHTACIGSVEDPIQSGLELYRVRYIVYRGCT